VIEDRSLVSTGYFTDLARQLESWRAGGVITKAQYEGLRDRL
jgi:uncharacterized membrane protein